MSRSTLLAEFIGSAGSRILVLAHRPQQADGRCVLVCPPFAEEMNKSRRMITQVAHRLCDIGYTVVVPDLFGTGDSEGDFSEATWDRWLQDLRAAEDWAIAQGWRVTTLLGVRLGCLLGAHYAARIDGARPQPLLIFWQPITDGARALEQFLRIRLAASLMRDTRETSAGLKAQLTAGQVVDVAGYGVSAELARGLDSVKMAGVVAAHTRIRWFEVLRSADAPTPLTVTRAIEQLLRQGAQVSLRTLIGEPFWAATEIVSLPELLDLTVDALKEPGQVADG